MEELERSLSAMKEQQLSLKEQLGRETERKKQLQQELENDHLRIVELERQLNEKRTGSSSQNLKEMGNLSFSSIHFRCVGCADRV